MHSISMHWIFSELNLYQIFFPLPNSCSQLLLNFFSSQILHTVWLLCWMSTTTNPFHWIPFGVWIPNLTSSCIKRSMLQLFAYFSWHDYYRNSTKMNISLKNIALLFDCHPFARVCVLFLWTDQQARLLARNRLPDNTRREQTLRTQWYHTPSLWRSSPA